MLSFFLLVVGLYTVFWVFEAFFYSEPGQTLKGRLRNCEYAFLLIGAGAVSTLLLKECFSFAPRELPEYGPLMTLGFITLYIFVGDFIFYWYHRLQHASNGILWSIHELHHSDSELNATTSMRTYWIERPLQTLIIVVPTSYVFGINMTIATFLPLVLLLWLLFAHSNLRLNLGFLTPIVTGPQLHRIHHSILPKHQRKNFAQFFPIIDILFGTYYQPEKNEFPTTGTPGMASDTSVPTALLRPLISLVRQVRKYKENRP